MVEAEDIGIKVALQILWADGVVDTIDSPLRVTPEAFDIVGMGASCNVLLGAVDHGFMGIAETGKVVVGSVFVGVDGSIVGMDVFLNHRDYGGCLAVGLYLNHGTTLALDHAHHHGLANGPATGVELLGLVLVAFLPADVSLSNFYFSEQRDAVFLGHQLTDLGEHPPGRLVGDADLSFKLLGRYARPGGSHEEHSVEPGLERCTGLMKDGVGSWGDVETAEFTRVDLAALNAVMAGYLIALGAMNAVRPTGLLDEFKARIFVWELSLEVLYRVLFHANSLAGKVRDVKG
jgi:hypothetical protein